MTGALLISRICSVVVVLFAAGPAAHASVNPPPQMEQATQAVPLASTQEFVVEAGDVSERISAIGRSVAYTVRTAGDRTDADLAERFQALAGRCGFAGQKLNELEPPTLRAKRRVVALAKALRVVRKDLRHIADAAAASDPDAAGAATRDLVDHSPAVSAANRALRAEVRRLRARG